MLAWGDKNSHESLMGKPASTTGLWRAERVSRRDSELGYHTETTLVAEAPMKGGLSRGLTGSVRAEPRRADEARRAELVVAAPCGSLSGQRAWGINDPRVQVIRRGRFGRIPLRQDKRHSA